MIWLALIGIAVVVAMALWTGRTLRQRLVIGAIAAAGLGGYWLIGKPGMPDMPLEQRLTALEARAATDADNFSGAEVMALLQHRARKAPKDPLPHKFIGDILQAADRPQEAMLAYQAALRRDPNHAPSLMALADLRFKTSAALDATTAALYQAAWAADPSNPRVGYMAGLADWQAGRKDEARALWAQIEASVPKKDPRQQMFTALRQTFAPDSLPPGESPDSQAPTR